MTFGDVPVGDAVGAILAHSVFTGGKRLRKGRVLTAEDVATLLDADISTIPVVRLDADDVDEDAAAARVAAACAGPGLEAGKAFTGRCNLTATEAGLAVIDAERVLGLNRVNEAVTLATLPPFETVTPGQVVATVKIVTFAVHTSAINQCAAIASGPPPLLRIAGFCPVKIGLIQTRLPRMKEGLIEKGVTVTRNRLAPVGLDLATTLACGHDPDSVSGSLGELSRSGCDIALILGASAIVDRSDVVPSAVVAAGGEVIHLGMPVDPGHLTLFARIGEMKILGLPGSARSPRLHGFDWVLRRLAARIAVTADDITAMGVGGLLKEIPGRPVPRVPPAPSSGSRFRIAGLILAAGQSRRMGAVNKLLAEIDGAPMVVHVADAVLASQAGPVIVVTGHEQETIGEALTGRDVTIVHNPDYADGLSTSLRRGLSALPEDIDGVVVCLGDMPNVTPGHLNQLIDAFDPLAGRSICVPTFGGKRGNPVLWGRQYFKEILEVAGDVGARHLIGAYDDEVHEVAVPDSGVLLDLDTPQALAAHIEERE